MALSPFVTSHLSHLVRNAAISLITYSPVKNTDWDFLRGETSEWWGKMSRAVAIELLTGGLSTSRCVFDGSAEILEEEGFADDAIHAGEGGVG
jgi:hypothetical protein